MKTKVSAQALRQTGFTLIELVIVIVILGVLASVALPKFVDLTGEAKTAALSGVAGAVSSAGTINYSAKVVGDPAAIVVASGVACATLTGVMDSFPVGDYSLSGNAPNCIVTQLDGGATTTAIIAVTP